MKYRIKRTSYKNGRISYTAYIRKFLYWQIIHKYGGESAVFDTEFLSREEAINAIDQHFEKFAKSTKIEIEYIIK